LDHDRFAAHRAIINKATAESWRIELVFIPPSCTNAFTSYLRQVWQMHYPESEGEKTTRLTLARNLLAPWGRIAAAFINSAWRITRKRRGSPPGDDAMDLTVFETSRTTLFCGHTTIQWYSILLPSLS
jgi:hypothetical protein